MGDNLKAASRFVSQSISSLDHITTAPQVSSDRILDKLADLQRGAKAMRARAIYRAAQTAVDMLHKGKPDDQVQSELNVVRSLVVQYQNGLEEILDDQSAPVQAAPVQSSLQRAVADKVIDFSAGDSVQTDTQAEPVMMIGAKAAPTLLDDLMAPLAEPDAAAEPMPEAVIAAEPHNAASSELPAQIMPLVQFAPEAEQRDALRRLSRLHGEMSGTAEAQTKAVAAEKPSPARPKMVAFETLMPELTNVVLTTARHLEKTVSISYAAHQTELNSDLAESVRAALSDLSVLLVTRSLEMPEVRRNRDESGAGHISIMAVVKSGLLELSVECTGRNITLSDLDIPSWTQLKNLGADFKLSREDGRLCLGVTGLKSKPLTSRRDISAPMLEQAS